MTELSTTITSITVFADRARITRSGSVALAAGPNTLVVAGLPCSLDADSVRVKGRGAGARIAGSEVAAGYVSVPVAGDTAALQANLDALRDQDAATVDAITGVEAQLEMLKAFRDAAGPRFAKSISKGKAPADGFKAVAAYASDEYAALAAETRALSAKRRDLGRDINAAENRLRQAQSTNRVETREIRIDVDATAPVEAEFDLTYMVHGAGWEPVYDARLSGDKLSLICFAQIRQTTGENWPACAISLSTAEVGSGGDIPELEPWYIARFEPPPPRPKRAMYAAAMAAPDELAVGAAPMPAPMAAAAIPEAEPMSEYAARIEESGIAVTYRAQRPIAVPSDGAKRKTLIGEARLDAALDYVSVPKLGEDVYLRAKATNASDLVFLPGVVNVFHDDELVGRTSFEEPISRNGEFELQLGSDNRIRVERELTQRDAGKALIGNVRRLTFAYKIKVANTRDSGVRLTLQDQIPVSRHEDIKVRLSDAQPRPTEQSDLNLLTWELDLPAGAKREVAFGFTVEHPRDMQVTGLE